MPKETVDLRVDKDVHDFLKKQARELGIPTKALISLILKMRTKGDERYFKFMEAISGVSSQTVGRN